jgi:enoyl-CoA hydratase/carnithine racemase
MGRTDREHLQDARESLMTGIALLFEPPLARVRLQRPDRRNAISRAMWLAMAPIAAEIEARADVAAVVVEGLGGHFSAGADISEFDEVYRDARTTRDYNQAIQNALKALASLDRPTLAILEGAAIGGGLALALACDLRFAAADAHLAIPPAKLGLLYGETETRRLVALVGPARAKDLLFSGRRIAAQEALAIGLVDRVLPVGQVESAALDYGRSLAGLSQHSIRGAKCGVEAITRGVAESSRFAAMVEAAALGPDFAEGRAAFAQKRAPKFADRGVTRPISKAESTD